MIRSRTASSNCRSREVDQVVVWSGDRSQDPVKAPRHRTARTCQTGMVRPAAASGRQGCSFVVSWGGKHALCMLLSAAVICCAVWARRLRLCSEQNTNTKFVGLEKNCNVILYQVMLAYSRSPRWSSGNPRMLLVLLIREFESRRAEILNLFAKVKKDQLTAESAY